MKFWMKSQVVDQNIRMEHLVNVCDEELLGKQFGDFKASEYFYKGELVESEEMLAEIQNGTLVDLFGNECVKLAEEAELVDEDNIKEIEGIKHAIIMKFQ